MPLALDPNQTFKVVLASDKGKPQPPVFIMRYKSSRKWRKIAELHAAWADTPDPNTMLDKVFEILGETICDWSNMPGDIGQYSPDKLEDILTPTEAIELMEAAVSP